VVPRCALSSRTNLGSVALCRPPSSRTNLGSVALCRPPSSRTNLGSAALLPRSGISAAGELHSDEPPSDKPPRRGISHLQGPGHLYWRCRHQQPCRRSHRRYCRRCGDGLMCHLNQSRDRFPSLTSPTATGFPLVRRKVMQFTQQELCFWDLRGLNPSGRRMFFGFMGHIGPEHACRS